MKIDKSRRIMFFVSLIGIVVVTLVMGTTFAYQTLVVDYKEGSDNELTIDVGKLDVSFTTSNKIELTNMTFLPDYKTADYVEFTVDNTDSSTGVVYHIDLVKDANVTQEENTIEELIGIKDNNGNDILQNLKYTLILLDDGKEYIISYGDFSKLSATEDFRLSQTNMEHHFLNKGDTQTMRLYIWGYDNKEVDLNGFLGKTFKRKINITSYFVNDIQDNTLAYTILKNAINKNNDTEYSILPKSELGEFALPTEKIISLTTDDFGMSYYYRGLVNNNYLEYNGTCYRIIRIQGNGSIKLVLANDGTCSSANDTSGILYDRNTTTNENGETVEELVDILAPYSCNAYKDNYFLGNNCPNEPQKKVVDSWYNKKYLNNETGIYDENLISNKWCIENEEVSLNSSGNTIFTGNLVTAPKSYNCISKLGLVEDRAALLSAAEITLSGDKRTSSGGSYSYISNEIINKYIWLLDIGIMNKSNKLTYPTSYIYSGTSYLFQSGNNFTISYNVRPVVVLKSGVLVYSGDGTKTNPYKITTDPSIVLENGS